MTENPVDPEGPLDDRYLATPVDSEILAIISHELRTPLAAIKGYASTLKRQSQRLGRSEREEFLQAIDDASSRLDVLVTRLLEWSQLESGTLSFHLVPVDMRHLALEAIGAAEQRLLPQTVEVGKHSFVPPAEEDLPPVLADLRLQREALDIVLENAVKFSPDGGIITVTLHVDGEMLVMRVRDSGIGIPGEHLQSIFRGFHPVHTQLTRNVAGIGLGLGIAKRIVERQGGTMWAESEPAVGSVFSMALPLVKPEG
ncbi:MAG TPA: HAMP domain-containing sensor histidine kinase [Ktedonobacterales bacterium]|nr:HAMP domain-containing sensor histidine kinase [Ktedonobacterales bacterium]